MPAKTPKHKTPGAPGGDINHPQAGAPPGTDNEAMLRAEHDQDKGKPAGNDLKGSEKK